MTTPGTSVLARVSHLSTDLQILDHNAQPRFYLTHKTWTTGPHLILRNGPTEDAAPIAAYKSHTFDSDEVCLGDYEANPTATAWVALDSNSIFSGKSYGFAAPDTGREFLLERSHDDEYDLSRFLSKGFLLKDAASGDVVTVFRLLSYNGKERCAFEWLRPVSPHEEVFCLMVFIGVYAAMRRRHNNNNSSGGSVGGGVF